jgi:hemerythrin superfamily protein
MGKALAKIKGAATKVGAAFTGKPGILGTLAAEHSEVSSLMKDVRESKSADKQRKLYGEIRESLVIHTQGEEQGIYAECRAHETTRNLVEKATRDHLEVKQILSDLDDLTVGSAQWMQKFDALARAFEGHVEFEEQRVFPKAKDILGSDALRDLDGRYKAHRKRIEEGGEPLEPRQKASGAM